MPSRSRTRERGSCRPGSAGLQVAPLCRRLCYLKDPDRRIDFWDVIKHIPIGDREDWYVSFGAQLRPWFQFYNNFDFGTTPESQRFSDSAVPVPWRLPLRPEHSLLWPVGERTGERANRRAFGGYRRKCLRRSPGVSRCGPALWRERYADLAAGSAGDVIRFGPTHRRAGGRQPASLLPDAARLLFRLGDWSVDGFWSKPVLNRPGVFDDIPYPDLSLWGLYAVRPLPWLPDGHTDLYYLGYENTHATFDKATPELSTGDELRNSLGTRLWGHPMSGVRRRGRLAVWPVQARQH